MIMELDRGPSNSIRGLFMCEHGKEKKLIQLFFNYHYFINFAIQFFSHFIVAFLIVVHFITIIFSIYWTILFVFICQKNIFLIK